MFRNTFQSGFLSILYAIGSKPLQIWRKNINNGYVKRITDFEMQSSVIEICGANVSTCFLSCPSNPKQTLGVKMPFLVLLIKYLKKYFTKKILHFRSPGHRWQKRQASFPRFQLPIKHKSETVHMHNPDEIRRRLEPNSL